MAKYEKFEKWMIGKKVKDSTGDTGVVIKAHRWDEHAVWVDWTELGEKWLNVEDLEFVEEKEEVTEESLIPWKVGDRVKFKKASIDNGVIDATEKDSFEVIAVSEEHWGVVVKLEGCAGHVSTSHLEHIKEGEMENREKSSIKKGSQIDWQAGQVVWDVRKGRGVVAEVYTENFYYPVIVEFDSGGVYTYTAEGKLLLDDLYRSLYFSEPEIVAETMPPKKPFVPKLKEGDKVLIKDKQGLFGEGTVRVVHKECDDRVYISKDGNYFMKHDIASLQVLGEEIKWD